MWKVAFVLTFLVASLSGNAASGKAPKKAVLDSIHRAAIVRRHAVADSIKQHVVNEVFTPEYADSLLLQIEHMHTTLNNITNEAKYGFKTREIRLSLQQMESAIQLMSHSMSRDSMVMNINNLQMFRGLLADMAAKLLGWREVLYKDHQDLARMSAEMNVFVQDSFTQRVAADTAFANLHLDEMIILNERWMEAQRITSSNLKRISQLQASVSNNYFGVTELQNQVGNQLTSAFKRTMAKEYNYIWDAQNPYAISDVIAYTSESFSERMNLLRYYLTINQADWLTIIILGLLFFFWVFRNFRKIKALTTDANRDSFNFKYILPVPVLSSIILALNLAPFYSFDQPAIYVEVIHIAILIPLTILFLRLWSKTLLYYWGLFIVLSLLTSIMNVIITPGWPLRFSLLGLSVSSVFVGLRFLAAYRREPVLGSVVRVVTVIYIIMNILAVIFNCAGRVTLAKIFTSSAIVGITQIIGLFALVPIIIEAFYIQMKSRRIANSMSLDFNYEDISTDLRKILTVTAVFLWLITLATNLEIYYTILTVLDKVLNTPRLVGSTTFTVGNILTFIFILYVVSILQKYVGYFFGETEEDFVGDLDKKESHLVIFRLVIIMIGFFIAVVASGLPVDKVTVVLGALGVGIGLGLQNIVYNLVSGVILIFEKPMQIGDYIEVSDKKGRVENIGIRASKLVTSDGSEVVVPNGDILSSHMVNWTRGNNNRRTQLTIEIEPASKLQVAKEIIMSELKKNHLVIQGRHTDILLNNLNEKSVEISINVWINSIYKEDEFKSDLRSVLYTKLAEKEIKII